MSNSEGATYTNYGDVIWRALLPSPHQRTNTMATNDHNISQRSTALMLVDAVKIAESVVVREWLNAIYEMLCRGYVPTFDAEHFNAMLKINVAKQTDDYRIFSGLVRDWFGTHGGAVPYGRPSRDFATFTASYSYPTERVSDLIGNIKSIASDAPAPNNDIFDTAIGRGAVAALSLARGFTLEAKSSTSSSIERLRVSLSDSDDYPVVETITANDDAVDVFPTASTNVRLSVDLNLTQAYTVFCLLVQSACIISDFDGVEGIVKLVLPSGKTINADEVSALKNHFAGKKLRSRFDKRVSPLHHVANLRVEDNNNNNNAREPFECGVYACLDEKQNGSRLFRILQQMCNRGNVTPAMLNSYDVAFRIGCCVYTPYYDHGTPMPENIVQAERYLRDAPFVIDVPMGVIPFENNCDTLDKSTHITTHITRGVAFMLGLLREDATAIGGLYDACLRYPIYLDGLGNTRMRSTEHEYFHSNIIKHPRAAQVRFVGAGNGADDDASTPPEPEPLHLDAHCVAFATEDDIAGVQHTTDVDSSGAAVTLADAADARRGVLLRGKRSGCKLTNMRVLAVAEAFNNRLVDYLACPTSIDFEIRYVFDKKISTADNVDDDTDSVAVENVIHHAELRDNEGINLINAATLVYIGDSVDADAHYGVAAIKKRVDERKRLVCVDGSRVGVRAARLAVAKAMNNIIADDDDTTTIDLLIIPPSANDSADASFDDTARVVDAAARQTQSYVGNIHVVDADMLDEIIAEQKHERKQVNGGRKRSKGDAAPGVSGNEVDNTAALLNDVRSKLTGRAFQSNDVRFIHRSSSGSWIPNLSLDVANMSLDDFTRTGYYYSSHCDHYPIDAVSAIVRVMGMLGIFPEDITDVFIVRNYDAIEALEAAGVRCVSGRWSKLSGYWDKPGGCAEIPDGAVIVEPRPDGGVNIARRMPRIVIDVDVLEAAGYDLRGGILDYYIHRHLISLAAFSNIPGHADRNTMEDVYSVLACGYKDYSDIFRFNYGECHQTMRLLDEYMSCISFTGDKFTERFSQLDKEISGLARLWVAALARTVLNVRPCADLDELGKQVELLKKITPIDSMLEAFYKYNISIDDILCVSSVEGN